MLCIKELMYGAKSYKRPFRGATFTLKPHSRSEGESFSKPHITVLKPSSHGLTEDSMTIYKKYFIFPKWFTFIIFKLIW